MISRSDFGSAMSAAEPSIAASLGWRAPSGEGSGAESVTDESRTVKSPELKSELTEKSEETEVSGGSVKSELLEKSKFTLKSGGDGPNS